MIRYAPTRTTDGLPALYLEMSHEEAIELAARILEELRISGAEPPCPLPKEE